MPGGVGGELVKDEGEAAGGLGPDPAILAQKLEMRRPLVPVEVKQRPQELHRAADYVGGGERGIQPFRRQPLRPLGRPLLGDVDIDPGHAEKAARSREAGPRHRP